MKTKMSIYRSSTITTDFPVRCHALSSIDNQYLMLNSDLVLGLDCLFKVCHTKQNDKNISTCLTDF